MHVGYNTVFGNAHYPQVSDREMYQSDLRLADLVEPLGLDSIWSAEHHFTSYSMCPGILQYLAYMAGRTRRIGLGSAAIILPWHDPMRIAAEIAQLDNISNGRVILGIGRGLGRIEFEGFRSDMNVSRERFVEYAEMILKGLEQGYCDYDGQFIKQPRRDIRPAPFRSFKGRTFATAVSPESSPIMAKLGAGLAIVPQKPWKTTIQDLETYREVYVAENHAAPPPPVCAGFMLVDENTDRAEEMAHKYIGDYYHTVMDHYEFSAGHLKDTKGYESYSGVGDHIAKRSREGAAADYANLMPWGTPAQIIEKCEKIHAMTGNCAFMFYFCYAGMSYAEGERNMRLFCSKVLPELKRMKMSCEPLRVSPVAD